MEIDLNRLLSQALLLLHLHHFNSLLSIKKKKRKKILSPKVYSVPVAEDQVEKHQGHKFTVKH